MDTEYRDRNKSNETKDLIRDAVTKNILFANLDHQQLTEIVDAMYKKNVLEGETIITQGIPSLPRLADFLLCKRETHFTPNSRIKTSFSCIEIHQRLRDR